MSNSGTGAAGNGRGSPSWSRSWTRLGVERRSLGYCRVTFDNPPINTITATTIAQLAELVSLIEEDRDLNVVVFDSANPDYFLAHREAGHEPGGAAPPAGGPARWRAWHDLLARLSRAPVISVAAIRGRVRGAGCEFVLACDLRVASRENALLGQLELGTGVSAAGAAIARLSGLVGRGRALEILLAAGDLDAARAERYGYVNRAVPDDMLDAEVDQIASRLTRFDHEAVARAKRYVDQATPPPGGELAARATQAG